MYKTHEQSSYQFSYLRILYSKYETSYISEHSIQNEKILFISNILASKTQRCTLSYESEEYTAHPLILCHKSETSSYKWLLRKKFTKLNFLLIQKMKGCAVNLQVELNAGSNLGAYLEIICNACAVFLCHFK